MSTMRRVAKGTKGHAYWSILPNALRLLVKLTQRALKYNKMATFVSE